MCRLLRGVLLDTGFEFFVTQAQDPQASAKFKLPAADQASESAISWASFELHVRLRTSSPLLPAPCATPCATALQCPRIPILDVRHQRTINRQLGM